MCEQPGVERFNVKAQAGGRVDAVVFWYDLHLDAQATISTGVDSGNAHVGAWGQAVKFLDTEVNVKIGHEGEIVVVHGQGGLDIRYHEKEVTY